MSVVYCSGVPDCASKPCFLIASFISAVFTTLTIAASNEARYDVSGRLENGASAKAYSAFNPVSCINLTVCSISRLMTAANCSGVLD